MSLGQIDLIDELTVDDATDAQISDFASLYGAWSGVRSDFDVMGPELQAAASTFREEQSAAVGDIEVMRGWGILAGQAEALYTEWSQIAGQIGYWDGVFADIRSSAESAGRWFGFGAVPLAYVLLASAVSVLTFLIAFAQGARQAATYYVGLLQDIRARRKTVDEAIVEGDAYQASIPSTPGEFFGEFGTGIERTVVGLGQGLMGIGLLAVVALVIYQRS